MSRDDAPNYREIRSECCCSCYYFAHDDEDYWVCRKHMFNIMGNISCRICDDWRSDSESRLFIHTTTLKIC